LINGLSRNNALDVNTVGDLVRDNEAYLASKTQEEKRLVTNKSLSKWASVNIPKTSYGVSMVQEAVASIGGAASRLWAGGKVDKSKTLLQAVSEREKGNETTIAKAVQSPLATLATPVTFVAKIVSSKAAAKAEERGGSKK